MEKVAAKLSDYLCAENIIPQEDQEVYQYCIEVTLSSLCYWTSILVCAVLVGRFWESVLYLAAFMAMRFSVGGYHASSHLRCALLSMATYVFFIVFLALFPMHYALHFIVPGTLVAVALVILLAPIDHPNKPFSSKERQKYRKNSLRTTAIIALIISACVLLELWLAALCLSFSLLQAAASLLSGLRRKSPVQAEL